MKKNLILGLALILIVTVLLGCGNTSSIKDYAEAVDKISSSATGLSVKSYTTNRQIVLEKEKPEFSTITNYVKKSKLANSQPRFVENDGKKTEVGIPYAIGFILEFTLSNGPKVVLDYGTDQFWFNTEETIYNADVEPGLYDILDKLTKG